MYILYCMNGFAILILASLLVKFGFELLADRLNIRALEFHLPRTLQDLYNPEEYRKSQEYLRVSTYFSLVTSAFHLTVTLVFWFSGGFNFLDNVVGHWGFVPIVSGVLYIGLVFLADSMIALPFSIYQTFVIERRFGFNRATPQTFILDRAKMLGLGVILGGALLAVVLTLFQYAGGFAWLYGWAGAIIFSFITQLVVPAWLMPLFYKFTPMVPGDLKESILAYTNRVDFPVKNIFVIDGSRRSSKSNAFFTGLGPSKRIALFDTLIEKFTADEIVAILAHEIGHFKKRHTTQSVIMSTLFIGLTLWLFSLCLHQVGLYQAFYMDHQTIYTGMLFFGLLYSPLELIFSIVINGISRWQESTADLFAATTIEKPEIMIRALQKLYVANLSNLTPDPFYVFLNYTHPPLLKRIQSIEKTLHSGQ